MIKVTVLMDNSQSENKSLLSEHGLSLFIETDYSKIIFDCGSSCKTSYNANQLNIDLKEADCVVCSHGHYDHAGGYTAMVADGVKSKLITGKNFFENKYANDGVKLTFLGTNFDEKFLKENDISHDECGEIYMIDDEAYIVGEFERSYKKEIIPDRFVKSQGENLIKDKFQDEVAMVLDTDKGLIVIVGCSHPGILNMISTISQRTNKNIYGVIGGTHLVEADTERIEYTIEEMKKMGVEFLALSHCSGKEAQAVVRECDSIISCTLTVGDSLNFMGNTINDNR